MTTHQQKAARFLAMAFAIVLLAISASTSFGFFYNHFYLIPPSLLGETVGQLISGIVGVLLFDAATTIWLIIYLNDAKTPEQRAISLLLSGATFLGAAAASVAHLALSATGTMALDVATLDTISMIALVCVILGVIANFGGSLMYSRFSYDNKISVRESDRADAIQMAEDEQARLLDSLIAQGVKERITDMAPSLAQEQAARLVAAFQAREMAKYAGTGASGAQNGSKSHHPPYNVEYRIPGSRADDWQRLPDAYTLDDAIREYERIGPEWARIVTTRGQVVNVNPTRPTPAPARNGNGAGYNYPRNDYSPE